MATNQNVIVGSIIGGVALLALGFALMKKTDARAIEVSNELYNRNSESTGGFTRRKKRNQNKTKRK
jgi:hypothetical protein